MRQLNKGDTNLVWRFIFLAWRHNLGTTDESLSPSVLQHSTPPPPTPPPGHMGWSVIDRIDRLAGLVVKASASRAEGPGFESRLRRDFSGSSHTSGLKIGTPVATLPGAWHYRVSTGTGRPGVSILWLGEVERWICNFYLSVTARKIVWADPSLRSAQTICSACCWDVKQPTDKQTIDRIGKQICVLRGLASEERQPNIANEQVYLSVWRMC